MEVDVVGKGKGKGKGKQLPSPSAVCKQCGRAGHTARDCQVGRVAGRVPPVLRGARAKMCFTCGKPGHLARDCRS
eukprot:16440672-Heterocapsa_arctica.AAC.1